MQERARSCLVGNHDLVALGHISGSRTSTPRRPRQPRWTANAAGRRFALLPLRLSPPSAAPEHAQLFHASARDPIWEYVLTDEAATATLLLTTAPVVLVGHSHIALAVTLGTGLVEGGLAPGGTTKELEGRWLLNPGSVGQPRDGDPNAAWLLLDFEARFASFRRVAYPILETQRELREAGLPEALASRLAVGQ